MKTQILTQLKKIVLILVFLFLFSSCFKAKRSPYDTNTPSGAAVTYASALAKLSLSPPPIQNSPPPITIEKPIRFVAKGSSQIYLRGQKTLRILASLLHFQVELH